MQLKEKIKLINNLLVPYEIALALKQKGFEEGCLARCNNSKAEVTFNSVFVGNDYYKNTIEKCAMPFYQQVVDWFRKEHKIHIEIRTYSGYYPIVKIENSRKYEGEKMSDYYPAFNKAIKEALKLI